MDALHFMVHSHIVVYSVHLSSLGFKLTIIISVQFTPKKGTAIIFDHSILHSGDFVSRGNKFVVKTEVIFKRTDWSSIPSLIVSYLLNI